MRCGSRHDATNSDDLAGHKKRAMGVPCSSIMQPLSRSVTQEVKHGPEGPEKGAGGEIQLTDALAKLIGKQPFHGLRFEGTRYDCGSRLGFIQANIACAMEDPEIGEDVKSFVKNYKV